MSSRTIRLFVSSPGDVMDERNQLASVVQELNTTLRALVPDNPIDLELIRWETHVHPDVGRDPQDVVNRQIGDYEIFLGVMWSRFGTPTAKAGSGTEEEFKSAYRGWEERRSPAHILFYFCEEPIAASVARENAEQLRLVNGFWDELRHKGLVGSYQSHSVFADTVRPDLIRVLSGILHAEEDPSRIAERAAGPSNESDLAIIQERVAVVAGEYEDVRASMRASDRRTRRLEVIASKMRTMAQSNYALLPDLVHSNSPGERLAAVSVLQVIPDARYLPWLAERVAKEKPFVGYHAAIALLAAARSLPRAELPLVEDAVSRARAAASRLRPDTDRAATLRFVDEELRRRL